MKAYPSISREIRRDVEVHVYDKLDGSNIRAEWSPKQGFYKFGSRKRLIGADDKGLGDAISIIQYDFRNLERAFKACGFEGAVAYFEYFGRSSFAGKHNPDEPHKCVLIDVEVKKKGFLMPSDFELLPGDKAPLLYVGTFSKEIETQVRNGTLPGMTFEGVVCKADPGKKWARPIMFKVKSNAWIDMVKSLYNDPKVLEDLL